MYNHAMFKSGVLFFTLAISSYAATITYDITFTPFTFVGIPQQLGGTGTITLDARGIRNESTTPTLVTFSAEIDGFFFDQTSLLYDGCGNPPGSASLCDATYGNRGRLRSFFLGAQPADIVSQLDFYMFDVPERDPTYEMYFTGGPNEGLFEEGSYTLTETPEPQSLSFGGLGILTLAALIKKETLRNARVVVAVEVVATNTPLALIASQLFHHPICLFA